MSILGGILAGFIGSALGALLIRGVDGETNARLLDDDEVKCGIRALEGRVHNIGTEWSGGTAHLSPGHLRFVPTIGIVGERNIDVISVEPGGRSYPTVNLSDGPGVHLIITTAKGQLLWGVPPGVVDDVIARVLPAAE